ncbi:MAG TPA: imidazole glycerol phosphate synthase subunit HisH [Chthonomonadales bacterium]|nr:imidazole glycerol phosphate synthase subunit HisH [Chthonomonadales bacterium]
MKSMIAIIDYGAGNLGSVYKALRYIGAKVEVTADPAVVARADKLVLPGVGAFSHCMNGLDRVGMVECVKEFIRTGKPFLGICVGLQMLFESSEEMGVSPGLAILPGRVVKFHFSNSRLTPLKIPHIGWNALSFRADATLFAGLNQGDRVYFVHSYYPEPADPSIVTATTEYGYPFCCAVQSGNIHATQFHPEKSGAVGLQILRNFVSLPA